MKEGRSDVFEGGVYDTGPEPRRHWGDEPRAVGSAVAHRRARDPVVEGVGARAWIWEQEMHHRCAGESQLTVVAGGTRGGRARAEGGPLL